MSHHPSATLTTTMATSTKHAGLLQNGMGFEKTRPGGNPVREDSDTIVADSSGHVTGASGATVDTHYAAQLRPSRLSGYGLTFMVSIAIPRL